MKKLVIMLMLIPSICIASPFLVCDPQAGVTHYKLTGPAWFPQVEKAQPDGSIKMDIATAAEGVNSITVAACRTEQLWGESCSESVPFEFERPARPATVKTIRIVP